MSKTVSQFLAAAAVAFGLQPANAAPLTDASAEQKLQSPAFRACMTEATKDFIPNAKAGYVQHVPAFSLRYPGYAVWQEGGSRLDFVSVSVERFHLVGKNPVITGNLGVQVRTIIDRPASERFSSPTRGRDYITSKLFSKVEGASGRDPANYFQRDTYLTRALFDASRGTEEFKETSEKHQAVAGKVQACVNALN